MQNRLSRLSKPKLLFLLGVTAVYLALVIWLNFLRGPVWWDEGTFWQTSVTLSDRLLPTLNELRDYSELNTPLPFIIFGAIEHTFQSGIAVGRLLNLVLSICMVFVIGWPTGHKGTGAVLCVIGLFLCPYYLWLSGRLYTEMIACFWGLLGLVGYVHKRYGWSCLAFGLAIASRQYMVAFPAAIALYEFLVATSIATHLQQIRLAWQWKWLAYSGVTMTILGWFYLFDGLAPQTALDTRLAPAVQQTTWSITPGGAVNFLAFVGLYLVIPEYLLFRYNLQAKLRMLKISKIALIATALLIYCLIFPPHLIASGNIGKLVRLLPDDVLKLTLLYGLALLACIRFSRLSLLTLFVFINSLIMMKAHPWDRYVLPLAVFFWYIKASGIEERLSLHRGKGSKKPFSPATTAL